MLNMFPVAAFATLPLPMQSGRCKLPRKKRLRLPGSKLELMVGVRYGPVSQRSARQQLAPRWTTQPAAVGKKLGYKPLPEHLQRSATLFRKVTPGPEQERAVALAGLDASGANGLLTRKSSGR
jgi:hypothetical protein